MILPTATVRQPQGCCWCNWEQKWACERGGRDGQSCSQPGSAAPLAAPAAGMCLGQDSDNMRINLNSQDILKIIIDVELHLLVVLELCALSFFTQGLVACF